MKVTRSLDIKLRILPMRITCKWYLKMLLKNFLPQFCCHLKKNVDGNFMFSNINYFSSSFPHLGKWNLHPCNCSCQIPKSFFQSLISINFVSHMHLQSIHCILSPLPSPQSSSFPSFLICKMEITIVPTSQDYFKYQMG